MEGPKLPKEEYDEYEMAEKDIANRDSKIRITEKLNWLAPREDWKGFAVLRW